MLLDELTAVIGLLQAILIPCFETHVDTKDGFTA
jgi:hypothetical protein